MNEEQMLKHVLELSEQAAEAERERAKALLLAQEEEFAQAVKQSLIGSPTRPGPLGPRPGPSTLDNENVPSSSSIPRDAHPHSQRPGSRKVTLSPVDIQLKKDEEFARMLEAEYDSGRPMPSSPPEANQRVDPKPSESPPLPRYADIVGKETGTR
jgi:hypothetical protein